MLRFSIPSRPRQGLTPSRWWLAWGVAAAIAYLLAAAYTWRSMPVRILYEGEAPPIPYRWVAPPPFLAGSNQPPQSGTGSVPTGLRSGSISTGDGQATVVFPEGSIPARSAESSADVRITPLNPTTVAPPPSGLRFDGNAYRIEATYTGSKEAVTLGKPITVVFRYPVHATELLRFSAGWSSLKAQAIQATLQIFATTDRLGVFAAAAPGP